MKSRLFATTCAIAIAGSAWAQSESDSPFDPANAVLDTSILLAAGAQEGNQSLRASFGWPTFQEGQVEGIYYRFDPDGYARFAPTERLDTDLFEVVCRPRTTECAGRQGPLVLTLTAEGKLRVTIEGLVPTMVLSVTDGVEEIPVPGRIHEPLEPALEAFLLTADELVIRESGGVQAVLPLTALRAVVGYLRWVAASQNNAALPAGWPIEAAPVTVTTALTSPPDWSGRLTAPRRAGWPGSFGNVGALASPPLQSEGAAANQAAYPQGADAQSDPNVIALLMSLSARLAMLEADRGVVPESNATPAIQPAAPETPVPAAAMQTFPQAAPAPLATASDALAAPMQVLLQQLEVLTLRLDAMERAESAAALLAPGGGAVAAAPVARFSLQPPETVRPAAAVATEIGLPYQTHDVATGTSAPETMAMAPESDAVPGAMPEQADMLTLLMQQLAGGPQPGGGQQPAAETVSVAGGQDTPEDPRIAALEAQIAALVARLSAPEVAEVEATAPSAGSTVPSLLSPDDNPGQAAPTSAVEDATASSQILLERRIIDEILAELGTTDPGEAAATEVPATPAQTEGAMVEIETEATNPPADDTAFIPLTEYLRRLTENP